MAWCRRWLRHFRRYIGLTWTRRRRNWALRSSSGVRHLRQERKCSLQVLRCFLGSSQEVKSSSHSVVLVRSQSLRLHLAHGWRQARGCQAVQAPRLCRIWVLPLVCGIAVKKTRISETEWEVMEVVWAEAFRLPGAQHREADAGRPGLAPGERQGLAEPPGEKAGAGIQQTMRRRPVPPAGAARAVRARRQRALSRARLRRLFAAHTRPFCEAGQTLPRRDPGTAR